MKMSMYQASVPAFLSMLKNLTAIIEKAESLRRRAQHRSPR